MGDAGQCRCKAVLRNRGAKRIRIEDPGDVKEGLREALAYKNGPVVVDAVVDPYVAVSRSCAYGCRFHIEFREASA